MTRLGITGANGFVGAALRRVAAAAGWDTVGIVRAGAAAQGRGMSLRVVDDPWSAQAWANVLGDVDCVVHLVSRAHHVGEGSDAYTAYRRDNVDVSEALISGLSGTPVRKVIYMSSIKTVAEQTHGIPIDADTVPEPTTAYGTTKLEAENLFAQWAAAATGNLIVLRPPLVYGPGVKGNFRSMLRIADSPVPLPIGGMENSRSMIALGNLCDVILASVSDEIVGIHRLPVADAEILSTAEVVTVLRAAMGRRVGIYRFPDGVLASFARTVGVGEQFRRISDDLVVDASGASAVLGWAPPESTIPALVNTALWYISSRR